MGEKVEERLEALLREGLECRRGSGCGGGGDLSNEHIEGEVHRRGAVQLGGMEKEEGKG